MLTLKTKKQNKINRLHVDINHCICVCHPHSRAPVPLPTLGRPPCASGHVPGAACQNGSWSRSNAPSGISTIAASGPTVR